MAAPDRNTLATMTTMSEFEDVVLAITYVTNPEHHTVYVERRGGQFRWSFAQRGGPYPLQREVASYLGIPHDEVVFATDTIDGWTVVRPEPAPPERVTAYGFIQPATDPAVVGARIVALSPV